MPRKKLYHCAYPNPIDIEIGKRLRKIRAVQEVSQRELGNYLHISPQQVQKYESAYNKLSVSMLLRIATFFRVPVGYFIDGIIDYRSRKDVLSSKHDLLLLRHFNQISSKELQEILFDIVCAIVSEV